MLLNPAADRPVHVLGQAALLERQVAEAEQVQRRIERLLRIVKAFEQILGAQRPCRSPAGRSAAARHRPEAPGGYSSSPNPVTPRTLNTSTL